MPLGVLFLVPSLHAQCPDGSPPPCGPVVPRLPRIQVLPFSTLGGDTASAYLAHALTDDLRDALASTRAVVLLTGASARAAADFVVRGSVAQRGASVRVDTRVERASTGRVLWSGSASRVPRDLPAVAAHVATQTLQAAGVRARPVVAAATADAHLFDLLRRARYQRLRRTEAGLNRSIALQREAIAYDSTSPEAWAGLARSLSLALRRSVQVADLDPDRVLPLALQAAERAVELDPVSPTAWLVRGQVAVDVQPGSRSAAIAAFRRALALDSAYTDAWGSLGIALEEAGDTAGARSAFARTVALSPDDSEHLTWMALHHMWQREYQVAARWADSAVAMDPALPVAHAAAAQATLHAGRPADALEHVGATIRLTGNTADFGNGVNVEALVTLGDTAAARAAQLVTVARAGPAPSQHAVIAIAIGWVALGDTARALAALTAYPSPGDLHFQLHVRLEPGLDPLRSHATFQRLLAPVGGRAPEHAPPSGLQAVPHAEDGFRPVARPPGARSPRSWTRAATRPALPRPSDAPGRSSPTGRRRCSSTTSYWYGRRLDTAAVIAARAVEADPRLMFYRELQAEIALARGRLGEARAAYEAALRLGDGREQVRALGGLERYQPGADLHFQVHLRDAPLDPLRADPRFQRLVASRP